MFYLISNNNIIQTEETPFEVHDDLIWIEAPEIGLNQKAVYENGSIKIETVEAVKSVFMNYKIGRDVIFCTGSIPKGMQFTNPNNRSGAYTQYFFGISGGRAVAEIENNTPLNVSILNLYDMSSYKDCSITYTCYDEDSQWLAVNPTKENLDVSVIDGPNTQLFVNENGITVFNAKGNVAVNNVSLDLNDPIFYHANTELQIEVAENSYALVVNYK